MPRDYNTQGTLVNSTCMPLLNWEYGTLNPLRKASRTVSIQPGRTTVPVQDFLLPWATLTLL